MSVKRIAYYINEKASPEMGGAYYVIKYTFRFRNEYDLIFTTSIQ